ncbi:MAG: hypothetical protein ACK4RM_01070 [Flavobacterium sp.]
MNYKLSNKMRFSTLGTIVLTFLFFSCEREISEDAVLATYPNTPDIFTDNPVGLTDAFFESFDPASGANPFGFGTDNNVAYAGTTSIRIDVPAPNDPEGGYIGGIFRDRGAGRNLTKYDALTFWAKGSTTATVDAVGFGFDFEGDKHSVSTSIQLSTDWRKYVIPIPDASKLVQERGMFLFSAGTNSTNGNGYTFWIDELRFEKLGNVRLLNPFILNGEDRTTDGFVGSTQIFNQLGALFNLANGQNVSVNAAPAYFNFVSSDANVPVENRILSPFGRNNAGEIFTTVIGSEGSAVVTATMGNTLAKGSLTVNAVGDFSFAPTPTRPASNVISIFSNHYTNTPVDFFNGFWQPFQTTLSAHFTINGDDILNYTNFNFVGIQFANPTLNLTNFQNLHFNMYIPNAVPANFNFLITVKDFGPDNVDGGGDDSIIQLFINNSPNIVPNTWMTFEFPINGLANKNNVGLIIFENINFSSLSNFYLDNIYFYTN